MPSDLNLPLYGASTFGEYYRLLVEFGPRWDPVQALISGIVDDDLGWICSPNPEEREEPIARLAWQQEFFQFQNPSAMDPRKVHRRVATALLLAGGEIQEEQEIRIGKDWIKDRVTHGKARLRPRDLPTSEFYAWLVQRTRWLATVDPADAIPRVRQPPEVDESLAVALAARGHLLTDGQRDLMRLVAVHGSDFNAAAEKLGKTRSAAKQMAYRARGVLQGE